MQWNSEHHPLQRLFAGLVEQAFCVEVGMCDPKVTDYIVSLLVDFMHVDRLYKLKDAKGRRLESIMAIVESMRDEDLAPRSGSRAEIHRHIGDFALFWAGIYPEGLRRGRVGVNPDHFVDYVGQGKESYAIASRVFDESTKPPGSVLRRLSEEFEVCAHGLGLVRRGWEQRDFAGWGGDPHLLY